MKRFISTQHEIPAPATQVWGTIAKGVEVEKWLPIIKSSRFEGENKRLCEMVEGGNLEETILASEATQTFIYRIDQQSAFPATDIVGVMRVEGQDEGNSRLYWDVEMQVESDEVFSELKSNIEQIYAVSAANLGKLN